MSRRLLAWCLIVLLAWLPAGGVLHAALAHGGEVQQVAGHTVQAVDGAAAPCAVCLAWALCSQVLPGTALVFAPVDPGPQPPVLAASIQIVSPPPVPQSRGPPAFA